MHMQFVSKSGGNQYCGTLYADFGIGAWQAFNLDEGQVRRGAQGGRGLSPRDPNRRLHQTRHSLVVRLRSRAAGLRSAGEFPGQTASDVPDELQRQGDVPAHTAPLSIVPPRLARIGVRLEW